MPRRRRFSPGVLGGFEPEIPAPKKKFLSRFTPSPDTADRLAAVRTSNIRRGAAPTGGAGAREVGREVTVERQAVRAGGSEGVMRMQRALRASGFDVAVDGVWGPQTEAAHKLQIRRLREAVQGNTKGAQQVLDRSLTQGEEGADALAKTFGPAGFQLDIARRGVQHKLSNAFEQRASIKQFAAALQAKDNAKAAGLHIGPSIGDRVAGWIGKGIETGVEKGIGSWFLGGPGSKAREDVARFGRAQMEWSARVGAGGNRSGADLLHLGDVWAHLTDHDYLARKTSNGVGRVGTTIQDYLQQHQSGAVQQSGMGAIAGPIGAAGGFVTRAAGGIVTGALSTPGALAFAVADPKGLAREMERSYAWQYGPLAEGDIAEFARRFNEAPAGPLMDLLTVATLGVGGAARLGMIPRLGPIRELHVPSHPSLQLRAARTQLMRYYQKAYDDFSMNHPQAPLVGSISRAYRRIQFEQAIRGDEVLVASSPFKEALRVFQHKNRIAPARRRVDATVYDRALRYGDSWRDGVAAEIQMRERRVAGGVDRAEHVFQTSEIRTLRRALTEYPDTLPPHIENLISEGVKLADLTEAMKIRLGMFSEDTAAQRKQLSWEIVADYRNIDNPQREGLDWLIRNHFSEELSDAIMQGIDGFVWAKAGGPGGDINAAYGAMFQEIAGDPFALPAAIVFPPGVKATSDVEILWQHTPEKARLPDLDLPEPDYDAIMQRIPIDQLPKELQDPVMLKQTLARIDDLTRRGIAYRDWYDRAALVISKVAEKYGMDPDIVAQLVAIFSQDTNPITGMNFVFKAMEQIKETGHVQRAGRYPTRQVAEANRVLEGKGWAGKDPDSPKRSSFYMNIIEPLLGREEFVRRFGNVRPVTVDRHVVRMFVEDNAVAKRMQGQLTRGGGYDALEQVLTALADAYGIDPKEVQAASWVTMKMLNETLAAKRRGWNVPEDRHWHYAADAHEMGWNKYFASGPEEYLFYQKDPSRYFDQLAEEIKQPDGGFTVHLDGTPDDIPEGGDYVAAYGAYETKIPVEQATPELLARHFAEMRRVAHYHQRPGVELRIGGWHNPEDGMVYLDLSRVFPNKASALVFAEREGQVAVFNRGTFESEPTGLLPDHANEIKRRLRQNADLEYIPTEQPGISGEQAAEERVTDLEGIPTARPEDLSTQGAISDNYGPPREGLGAEADRMLSDEARGHLADQELRLLVRIPEDAYTMTKAEAYMATADPNFVYHGTSDAAAARIMQERKIRPGGPLGSPLDRAWVSEDPYLAATHASKAQYAETGGGAPDSGGTVIAIPKSAIPMNATKHGDSGTTTWATGGEGYLFQRGRKTKITAEEVDTDVVRGAAAFDPANRLRMFLGPEADASTPFHELAHGLRRHLPEVVGPELWRAVEDEVAKAVGKPIRPAVGKDYSPEKHTPEAAARKAESQSFIEGLEAKHGVSVGGGVGRWSVEHEEYFARAATRWFREGNAPSPALLDAYSVISEALKSLYPHAQQAGPAPGIAMRTALSKGGRPFTGDAATGAAFVPDVTRRSLRGGRGKGFPRVTGNELRVRQNKGILFTRARHVSDPEVTLRDFERTSQTAFKLISVESLEKFAEPWDWETSPIRDGYVPVVFRGKNPIPRVFQEEFDVMERTPKEYSAMVRQSEAETLTKVFPAPSALRQLADQEGADNVRVYQIPKKVRDAYLNRSVRIPAQAANDNPLTDAFDLVNTITKGAVVYGKLSYIPVNYAGNVVFLTIDSGPFFAVSALKRSMRTLGDLDVEDLAWIDSQVGEGPAASLATEKGRIADVLRDLAAWQSNHADRGPRRAAWIAAARRHGIKSKEQIRALREDPNMQKLGRQIGMEAEDAMVRFRGLTPFERDVMGRLIFLYGWTRGATRWLWNFTSEKPLLADVTYHLGQEGADYIQRTLGVLPSYMRTLVPWGAKMRKRGVDTVSVRDFQSVSPVATGAQVLEAGVNFAQGDPRAAGSQVVDFLSPALKTPIEMVTGQNLFLQEPYKNRFDAVTDQPGRWPLVKLGRTLIDPTVDVTDAYGNSQSRTNYLPPGSAMEARKQELEYFLGGGILRGRDLNLTQANARGEAEQQRKEGTPDWNVKLSEDAKEAGMKMPKWLEQPALVKAQLDDDPRTDSGTPYTQKLQAAVDAFAQLYPQNAAMVKRGAQQVGQDEEQARRYYIKLRDIMFSDVNEFRGQVDDKLEGRVP